MIVKIHHKNKKTEFYSFKESKIKVYIGRRLVQDSKHQSIVIDEPTASRKHLLIQLKNKKIYAQDLQSSNGTKINDEAIEPKQLIELTDGDLIQIAESQSRISVELRETSDASSSMSPQNKHRQRSRAKNAEQTQISESTIKMLKQMTSDKKTKQERIRFLKLMGCKNVDEEWPHIEKYLKKQNKFTSSTKKTNEDLQKQFSSSRNAFEKMGLGSRAKGK